MTGEEKVETVDLKVPMHCRACERTVFNSLRKVKGLEAISIDRNMHKVTVKGRQIDQRKLLKRIKKKTGKRAEIMAKNGGDGTTDGDGRAKGSEPPQRSGAPETESSGPLVVHGNLGENQTWNLDIFSDENPNACLVM